MCWLRIADDSFLASNFASSWNLGSIRSGELAVFQVEVGKFLARKPSWSRHMSLLHFLLVTIELFFVFFNAFLLCLYLIC